MFAERCKKSGEFIHRTVDDVEGVYLLKVRSKSINYGNQFELDDPYGHDLGGDGYVETFVRGESQFRSSAAVRSGKPPQLGYAFAETVDVKDGQRYRYTGRLEEPWQRDKSFLKGYIRFVLDKAPAPGPPPHYGVTYDDISTREEREYWIAGSSLKVIDLRTNEVIAERVGYMMDRGQGNDSGGRAPWLLAASSSCPAFRGSPAFTDQLGQTYRFVQRVLRPKFSKGE